jgi:sulfite exporter TauE/SafE
VHSHTIPAQGDLALLFLASLLGSAHCVGMCGPYVALCSARIAPEGAGPKLRTLLLLLFNAGRVGAYSLLGFLVGAFGQIGLALGEHSGFRGALALAAGVFACLCGLALMGVLPDPARLLAGTGLDGLLRGGTLSAFRAPPYLAPVLLGSLQGAFPCALVYGAASRAAVAGSPLHGAGTMLVFGLGTIPAIFALAALSPTLLARLRAPRWAGAFIVVVGVLLVLRGLAGLRALPETLFW